MKINLLTEAGELIESFELGEPESSWLTAHAEDTGKTEEAILLEAIQALFDKHRGDV